MRVRWRVHLLALGTYTLWALVLTWPLLTRISTHVPGNGADDPPLTWNLWWIRYALLELHANPFQCSHLFYPIGINLAFYTLTLLNGFLSVPLQAYLGLVTTTNMLLLSSFVLGGYGTFLLVTDILHSVDVPRESGVGTRYHARAAALSAGLLYAFVSSKLYYASLGQWNIASSQWIPFYVLYLFRAGRSPSRLRYPLLAGLFLVLQAYAELTYATFLVLFTLVWAAWRIWLLRSAQNRRQLARLVVGLAVVMLAAAIGMIPILANMIPDMLTEGDVFAEGGGFADVFSADLAGFLVPTSLHPLFGDWVERLRFPHDVGQHLYLGYSLTTLSAVGVAYWLRRGRTKLGSHPNHVAGYPPQRNGAPNRERPGEIASPASVALFWSASAFIWWVFTLGPTLRVNGQDTGMPLLFRLVEQLPFLKGNRYPSRYGVLLALSLAVLAGMGVAALLDASRRQNRRWRGWALRNLAPLLVLVALFEHLSAPLPLSDMRVPRIYEQIASSLPGKWTLLDIPVAWRNGSRVTGTLDTIIMFEQYYQAAHERPILAGNTSRNPPLKFQYFAESPVISTLIALETGHAVSPDVIAQDQILAPKVLRFFSIQAIVVHPDEAGAAIIPYIETTMPISPLQEDADATAYQVALPSWPTSWTITPGDALSRLAYAEGWGVPAQGWIWAQRKRARLLVPTNGRAQTLKMVAYAPPGGQIMRIEVNRNVAGTLAMAEGSHEYSVEIPASLVREGLNEVDLRFARVVKSAEMNGVAQPIGQTGVNAPVSITVQSAGNEVGDLGLIYVDGRQVSPNHRGYNVVVLDARTGSVEDAAAFDTHMDARASQALADYLMQIPAGRLVAVAAADEASRLLGPEATLALREIGAVGDLRGKFRWGHVIVGVKGARPGTAMEAMDWIRPVSRTIGTGATEPSLAAGFGVITFSASTP